MRMLGDFNGQDLALVSCSLKTRLGKLCGEPASCSDRAAAAFAWVGLQQYAGSVGSWAQVGNQSFRPDYEGYRYDLMYLEIWIPELPEPFKAYVDHADPNKPNFPADGETHYYEVYYNQSTDYLQFNYDSYGLPVLQLNMSGKWSTDYGRYASWTGEIFGYETDMPGTNGDRCEFSHCMVQTISGAWDTPSFQTASSYNADSTEWSINFTPGADWFQIWDQITLP